jgi:phosphosulfolactate synthase (CoM biosynthesis protein A)
MIEIDGRKSISSQEAMELVSQMIKTLEDCLPDVGKRVPSQEERELASQTIKKLELDTDLVSGLDDLVNEIVKKYGVARGEVIDRAKAWLGRLFTK